MINAANLKMLLAALAVIGSVALTVDRCTSNPGRARLAGSPVIGEPVQDDSVRREAFERKGFTIAPFARFTVRARLLSVETYRMGREAELSPIDFALGWNDMSNDAVLARLAISQGNRFYYYRWENEPPIAPEAIVRSSANMHLIPASADVQRRLDRVPPGATVTLSGWLVDVSAADGWQWRSSRSRSDTGAGACELVWVEDVQVEER
jgi:hypothetical protein